MTDRPTVNRPPEVQGFDTFDEMLEVIDAGRQAAIDAATDEQNAITYGDHWLALYNMGEPEGILAVFGTVWTLEHLREQSAEAGGVESEIRDEIAYTKQSHESGYRFGEAFSLVEPRGELGSTHVAAMAAKITPEQFEWAKKCEWDPGRLFATCEWFGEVIA